MGNSFKNETFLRELVREILESELSERSKENKAKKNQWQKDFGQSFFQQTGDIAAGDAMRAYARGDSRMGTDLNRSADDAYKMADHGGTKMHQKTGRNLSYRSGGPASQGQGRQGKFSGLDGAIKLSGSGGDLSIKTGNTGQAKVPPAVFQATQKGGKVTFGRYYDATGRYLGRTQGGKWVDAASDPQAKSQMEIVKKLSELKASGNLPTNRDELKEVVREVMRSCS
jgi:hypothetical protein